MSRPRKPFGVNQPGRLPSTMVKVLAAEMSDPHRLSRGKRYAKDGSVLDIVVEPGVVTCEIQGSRSTPYLASIEVTRGDGMPLRRDVTATCTCPDADNWDGHICKHVVAALFALADEFLVEPELLDLWRGRDTIVPDTATDEQAHDEQAHDHGRTGGVRDGEGAASPRSSTARGSGPPIVEEVTVDPLADFLRVPAGAVLPPVPHLEPLEPVAPRRAELAAVLRDAVAHLRIEWD